MSTYITHVTFRVQVVQSMVWQDGPLKGQAKGLRKVCSERFGDSAVAGVKQDGLVQMLEKEADFRYGFKFC